MKSLHLTLCLLLLVNWSLVSSQSQDAEEAENDAEAEAEGEQGETAGTSRSIPTTRSGQQSALQGVPSLSNDLLSFLSGQCRLICKNSVGAYICCPPAGQQSPLHQQNINPLQLAQLPLNLQNQVLSQLSPQLQSLVWSQLRDIHLQRQYRTQVFAHLDPSIQAQLLSQVQHGIQPFLTPLQRQQQQLFHNQVFNPHLLSGGPQRVPIAPALPTQIPPQTVPAGPIHQAPAVASQPIVQPQPSVQPAQPIPQPVQPPVETEVTPAPRVEVTSNSAFKLGECPVPTPCSDGAGVLVARLNVEEYCETDVTCPGVQKCCFDLCADSYICQAPAAV